MLLHAGTIFFNSVYQLILHLLSDVAGAHTFGIIIFCLCTMAPNLLWFQTVPPLQNHKLTTDKSVV